MHKIYSLCFCQQCDIALSLTLTAPISKCFRRPCLLQSSQVYGCWHLADSHMKGNASHYCLKSTCINVACRLMYSQHSSCASYRQDKMLGNFILTFLLFVFKFNVWNMNISICWYRMADLHVIGMGRFMVDA